MTGLVVQEPEAHSHDQGDPDQHGDLQDGVGGQRGKVLVQGADGGTAGVDQADTVDDLLHTQGSDKGLDLQVRNDQTVAQTHDGADGNDQNEHHRGGQSGHVGVELTGSALGLRKDAGQAGSKTSQTACGQVVAGGDQTAGDAQRDDVADGHVLEQVDQVCRCKKVRMDDADEQRDEQHQNDNGVVAQPFLYGFTR